MPAELNSQFHFDPTRYNIVDIPYVKKQGLYYNAAGKCHDV